MLQVILILTLLLVLPWYHAWYLVDIIVVKFMISVLYVIYIFLIIYMYHLILFISICRHIVTSIFYKMCRHPLFELQRNTLCCSALICQEFHRGGAINSILQVLDDWQNYLLEGALPLLLNGQFVYKYLHIHIGLNK